MGDTYNLKTLVVTDLHLMEKEMPYTKYGVKNSLIILDELIRKVEMDEEIGLIILLGDIANEEPTDIITTMTWENRIDKLRRLVNSRSDDMPELKVWNRDGKVTLSRNRLMSIKGNHDFCNNDRWVNDKTYFDSLVERGFLSDPHAIMFKDNGNTYYYHLRNFGEGDKTLGKEYVDADKVVVFAHDWFYDKRLPDGYKKWAGLGRVVFELESALSGVDVFIQGHSHSRYEPFVVSGITDKERQYPQKKETAVYIPGTNARTPYAEDMLRDVGYNLVIDTTDTMDVSESNIILKPYKDYFNVGYKK